MTQQHRSIKRRCFLSIAAGGAAAAALGTGCAGGPSGLIPAGNIGDLVVGSLRAVAGEAVAIGRDADGVYAMTLICTHASCDMSTDGDVSAAEVFCSCHGSVFSANGAVVQGPANQPLEHYAVTIDSNGDLTIDADTTVVASERTAVL